MTELLTPAMLRARHELAIAERRALETLGSAARRGKRRDLRCGYCGVSGARVCESCAPLAEAEA